MHYVVHTYTHTQTHTNICKMPNIYIQIKMTRETAPSLSHTHTHTVTISAPPSLCIYTFIHVIYT